MLPCGAIPPRVLTMLKQLWDRGPYSWPGSAQRVGCASLDQGFEDAAVQIFRLDGLHELESILESSFLGAGGADFASRAFADIFDCRKAEAHLLADGSEIESTLVHIRRQDGNARGARLVDV